MKPRNARLVSHGLIAASAVLAIGSAVGIAHADPVPGMNTNCMSNVLGALFCDSPVRADGTWTRCYTISPMPIMGGGYGGVRGWTMPYSNCFKAPAPLPLLQPIPGHIGDNL